MDQQQEPRWRPTRRQLLWAVGIVGVLTVAVLIGYRYDITLWDWIKLLIVPAVIAGGGLWFNTQQRDREQHLADERAQDEALQAYLDQMSDMLISNKDQPSLYKARPGDGLSEVARARTLTLLTKLDGSRKARVVQFLYQSGLITKGRRVLTLGGADLGGADLSGANLTNADLRGAYLSEANLIRANLWGAYLRGAYLSGAVLRGAYLGGADISGAHLGEAVLSDAQGVTNDQLRAAARSLKGATMPNGQKYEDWLKSKNRKEEGKNDGSP